MNQNPIPNPNTGMSVQAMVSDDGQSIVLITSFGPLQQIVMFPVAFVPQVQNLLTDALSKVPRVIVPKNGASRLV